jgi:hypothetical protein
MSLELLNTIAGLITVTVVSATAVAALIQLRHIRAGNQIKTLVSIGEKLDSRAFREALAMVNTGLEQAMSEPAFRAYELSIFRRLPPPEVQPRYIAMHDAIVLVGNTFEQVGILIKTRVVDAGPLVDQYCGIALGAWKRVSYYVAFGREAAGTDASWEHFEYLAVLSEDWIRDHPSSYPQGVRRMVVHNPWPVPPRAQ